MKAHEARDYCVRSLRADTTPWRRLITGVGLARKPNGTIDHVVVLVSKHPPEKLVLFAARLAARLESDVEIFVTGRIRALTPSNGNPQNRYRPAFPGISIGHPSVSAGTFGAAPYDRHGNLVILSNNHVLANENNARLGDPILQPGAYDGGQTGRDILGYLKEYLPLQDSSPNAGDMAIAEPINEDLIEPRVRCLERPLGSIKPGINMPVVKSGRTTGLTKGRIVAVGATIWVQYDRGPFEFTDQLLLVGVGGTSMSAPGDSGSLVLDSQMHACGLLFAGSDRVTIATPIRTVEQTLNVKF